MVRKKVVRKSYVAGDTLIAFASTTGTAASPPPAPTKKGRADANGLLLRRPTGAGLTGLGSLVAQAGQKSR